MYSANADRNYRLPVPTIPNPSAASDRCNAFPAYRNDLGPIPRDNQHRQDTQNPACEILKLDAIRTAFSAWAYVWTPRPCGHNCMAWHFVGRRTHTTVLPWHRFQTFRSISCIALVQDHVLQIVPTLRRFKHWLILEMGKLYIFLNPLEVRVDLMLYLN